MKPFTFSIQTDSRFKLLLLGLLPVATSTASTSKVSTTSLDIASVRSIFTGHPGIIFVA